MQKKGLPEEYIIKSSKLIDKQIFSNILQFKMFCNIVIAITKDKDKQFYSFSVRDMLEKFGSGSENYAYLKKQCKEMFIASIDVQLKDTENKEDFLFLSVFHSISFTKQEGVITFRVNEEIKQIVLDYTKGFTKYYLDNVLLLNSSYSMQLYELLKQYEKIGYREVRVDSLKLMLGINKNQYLKFNHFKERVIISSQKELKEKTDIYFTFDEIKTGRKITDIVFNIFKNDKEILILDDEKSKTIKKLISLGVEKARAKSLCSEYETDILERNISHVQNELIKGRVKDNIAGFIISAIKGDYGNQKQLFEETLIKKKPKPIQTRKRKVLTREQANKLREREESDHQLWFRLMRDGYDLDYNV